MQRDTPLKEHTLTMNALLNDDAPFNPLHASIVTRLPVHKPSVQNITIPLVRVDDGKETGSEVMYMSIQTTPEQKSASGVLLEREKLDGDSDT